MTREHIKASKRFKVLNRDGFACQYCGRKSPEVKLEIDHIKPVSKGGDNSMENLVTSCFDCNRGKGSSQPSVKTEEQIKIDAMTSCAILFFKEKACPIKASLAKTIITDLVYVFNLNTSEIMAAIDSSATPQHFIETCLTNYYHDLIGG